MKKAETYPHPVYTLHRPKSRQSAAVFSSPHSGSCYSDAFVARSILDITSLRSSEDAFVDELFMAAPDHGAPLLCAKAPRAYIDLNRAADELDPALIAGAPKSGRSPRINAGLGVIPRVVSDARMIQNGKITLTEATSRIDQFYTPYHEALDGLMHQSREQFGYAFLIDCHSMPNEALAGSPSINGARPEIVLGDRFGASCDRWLMDAAMQMFRNAGFHVVRNAPFAGGYITQKFGRPSENFHALQIEIDRSLYMHEKAIEKNARFTSVQRQLTEIVRGLANLGCEPQQTIAAE